MWENLYKSSRKSLRLYIFSESLNLTSMIGTLQNLANEIVNGSQRSPAANEEFKAIINDTRVTSECLSNLNSSDAFAFVFCNNMLKLMEQEEFNIVSETRSEENITNYGQADTVKAKVYGQMIYVLSQCLLTTNKPSYITKSMMDLVAMSLKSLFEENSYSSVLEKTIQMFVSPFMLPPNFNTTNEVNLQVVLARYNLLECNISHYCMLLQILISMFEYLTFQSTSKTYYEYRRCIYIFRNSYLAFFLYFGIEACKLLFAGFDNSDNMYQVVNLTLEYLENIFMYPFTLSLHEFQIDEDSIDNISGASSGDVYFPSYFRHVLCDVSFMENLFKYSNDILLPREVDYESKRKPINSVLKILSRMCIPSQYTFKNDDEKQLSREFALKYMQYLCQNFKYTEFYYMNTIIDLIYKLLTMYDYHFNQNKIIIIEAALNFCYQAIQQVPIKVQEGRRNPFSRIFQVLAVCIEQAKDKYEMEDQLNFNSKSQQILEKALSRILSPEAEAIMKHLGYNQPNEIDCFSELFDHILPTFELNLEENLNLFQRVNVSNLSRASATIWLHLCAHLLPKTTANQQQTSLILKYYELAKQGDNLASLRYIKVLLTELLSDFIEGEPSAALWLNIQDLSKVSFKEFLLYNIQLCINNFRSTQAEIIDYSLDLFKSIYISLKKNEHSTFKEFFYSVVSNLLQNINQTIFSDPKYYHKRRAFFNVISVIWINSQNISYIYQIHDIIVGAVSSNTPESFLQYLQDVTGLLEPLDVYQAFEVMCELIIVDLQSLMQTHFTSPEKIKLFFNSPDFMKIFCKLCHALINDLNRKLYFQSHTKIPIDIHNVIYPVLKVVAEGGFEYPRIFSTILEKMAQLNPLSELIPFQSISKSLKEQNGDSFDRLLRTYFEHIHRLKDISWMYQYIEGNVEHMVCWWEEAMVRNIKPSVSIRTIAESRFWTTNRHRDTFAKLVFQLSYYDRDYWPMEVNMGERAFVEEFARIYGGQ